MKTVFTTGEAAEICKVSQQTIIRCFDNGQLKGFRVPGSKFRPGRGRFRSADQGVRPVAGLDQKMPSRPIPGPLLPLSRLKPLYSACRDQPLLQLNTSIVSR